MTTKIGRKGHIDHYGTLRLFTNSFSAQANDKKIFNPLPHRDAFNAFANRAFPDQTEELSDAALVRAPCSRSTLFSKKLNML